MNTLKEMVSGDKKVRFLYYRKGDLWYITECGFVFPVPIADTGDGTFVAEDRAMLFMRYIRKYIESHRDFQFLHLKCIDKDDFCDHWEKKPPKPKA